MLELSLILELFIGRYTQGAIIGLLIAFNAAIGFLQENHAQTALALLKKRLSIHVKTHRDGAWKIISSEELVPGDIINLRLGDLIPADIILLDGALFVDQSSLTGESLPVEAGAGKKHMQGASFN